MSENPSQNETIRKSIANALDNKKNLNDKFIFVGAPKYDKYFQSFQKTKLIPVNPTVVIFLNKEMHVGIRNWNIFADFYKKMNVAYKKAYPNGDGDLNNFIGDYVRKLAAAEGASDEMKKAYQQMVENRCFRSIYMPL